MGQKNNVMNHYFRNKERFADYPLSLYCINEQEEFETFHTEIKEVFELMKLRKDKKGLLREINEKPQYQRMNIENYELLSVLLDAPKIWENRNEFKTEGREEYNMCQALREAFEEERSIGWAEGNAVGKEIGKTEGKAMGATEKTKIFVTNMLRRGMSDEDIMALAECSQEFVNEVRKADIWR